MALYFSSPLSVASPTTVPRHGAFPWDAPWSPPPSRPVRPLSWRRQCVDLQIAELCGRSVVATKSRKLVITWPISAFLASNSSTAFSSSSKCCLNCSTILAISRFPYFFSQTLTHNSDGWSTYTIVSIVSHIFLILQWLNRLLNPSMSLVTFFLFSALVSCHLQQVKHP